MSNTHTEQVDASLETATALLLAPGLDHDRHRRLTESVARLLEVRRFLTQLGPVPSPDLDRSLEGLQQDLHKWFADLPGGAA